MEIAYLCMAGLAFCAAMARTLRARGTFWPWVALLAILFFAVHTAAEVLSWDGTSYRDFLCFWLAGNDLRAGREPYSEAFAHHRAFLNPPTALPVFAALASLSAIASFAVWTACNTVLVLALLPMCRKGLTCDESPAAAGLDTATLLTVTAAVALSNATRSNLINGQMGILVAFALVLAYWGRSAGNLLLSTVAMTVATIKINLMLPFGLLFLRPRHRPLWIWMPVLVLAICLSTAGIADQWSRAETLAGGIRRSASLGEVNDYSRASSQSADILGLDKLFYHLGFADRDLIRILQLSALLVLGVCLGVAALRRGTPPGLAASLIALYAVIFLYHRNYDAIVLSLPLAFAVGHARVSKTAARWWMTAAALAMLTMLYLPRKALLLLMHHNFQSALASRFVEGVVLPSATWLILLSMTFLWLGAKRLRTGSDLQGIVS